ncbi:MAG: hypothetical protein ABJF10_10455 [Chthoniobacter sp.]|uniref:hypothetical protein n=1 Tax=Chthoniobacter sp. TaxID=2510640 RepID=UPI0032ADE357
MSATEILAKIPRLTPDELHVLRRALETRDGTGHEASGTGVRPPGYEALHGCMADEPALEIPERHHWRPAPSLD